MLHTASVFAFQVSLQPTHASLLKCVWKIKTIKSSPAHVSAFWFNKNIFVQNILSLWVRLWSATDSQTDFIAYLYRIVSIQLKPWINKVPPTCRMFLISCTYLISWVWRSWPVNIWLSWCDSNTKPFLTTSNLTSKESWIENLNFENVWWEYSRMRMKIFRPTTVFVERVLNCL